MLDTDNKKDIKYFNAYRNQKGIHFRRYKKYLQTSQNHQ